MSGTEKLKSLEQAGKFENFRKIRLRVSELAQVDHVLQFKMGAKQHKTRAIKVG